MQPPAHASSLRRLRRWLLAGEWRAHPLRSGVAILAIAVGVALGFAINLINSAALNEFSAAVQTLSGQADLQVRGAEATLDEELYPELAAHPAVAVASPVLEVDAALPDQKKSLKILGVDVFRAAEVTPELIGTVLADQRTDTLADDAIFLSPAALQWLQLQPGGQLQLRAGTATRHPARGRHADRRTPGPAPRGHGYRRAAMAPAPHRPPLAHRPAPGGRRTARRRAAVADAAIAGPRAGGRAANAADAAAPACRAPTASI